MTDADARAYAIAALEGFATELEGAIVHARELDAADYIDRMRTAATRLDQERAAGELELRFTGIEADVAELAERVEFVARRVVGGPPAAGVVPLDGAELDRDEDSTVEID